MYLRGIRTGLHTGYTTWRRFPVFGSESERACANGDTSVAKIINKFKYHEKN